MNAANQQTQQSFNNSKTSPQTLTEMVSTENKSFKRRGPLQQKIRKLRYLQSLSLITQVSWKQRIASLLLVLSIFSNSVFASPDSARTMVVTAGEYQKSLQFQWAANKLGMSYLGSFFSDVFGFFFKPSTNRQQQVERVIILPSDEKGELTVMQGERINLTAIGLQKGQPAGGLQFNWSITDTLRKRPAKKLNNGVFEAKIFGTFTIIAETQGVQAQINVTVLPNEGIGVQKLLEKSEAEKNDREKQGIAKLRVENKVFSREISSKTNYKREDEEKRNEEFKQKQNEVKTKQNELKSRKPNPFQTSEKTETNEAKPEGVDRAEAEGMVDEEKIKAAVEEANNERKTAEAAKSEAAKEKKSNTKQVSTSKEAKTVKTITSPMYRPADEDGWNGSNWWEADNPGNEVGNPPGSSPDAGAGNGNFQFSAPVVALPGRGMDINLSLNYNSRVWSKTGNTMSFDSDKGNPAPGWNLGFGKMMFMGANGGCMMVDADGTRKAYGGSNSTYSYGSYFSNSFTGHSTDNSFIDYTCYYSSGTWGTYMTGTAKLANGTTVYYGSQSTAGDQIYPTQITDANGNYITITYQNNHGPNITTVTDTMGRVINFNYDGYNRLISVTVPGFNGGSPRTAVQLHYNQMNLYYSYPGLTIDVPTNTPWVIDAIYYPGTNTGYWFGDGDSYSSYGMIQKIAEKRGMSSTGSTNDQGTVNPGNLNNSKLAVYNFLTSGALNDAPTYDSLTESWDGMDTAPAQTLYNVNKNDSHWDGFSNSPCYTTKITQPNGLISKQYAYRTPNAWTDGLIFADETIKVVNNQEVVISSSQVSWGQGVYDTARPGVTWETDERQQTKRTELTYGPNHNQVISKKEFGYNNELLRETRTDYVVHPGYSGYGGTSGNHIFSLVKYNEVYDGAGNRVARTEYEYDNNAVQNGTNNPNLAPANGVIMHNATADPFTTITQDGNCVNGSWNYSPQCEYEGQLIYVGDYPQWEDYCHFTCYEYEQVSVYDSNTVFRGNVTKITSYADANNATPTQAVINTKKYDITGNLVAESADCCEQKTYTYNLSTQFAYPVAASRGSSNAGSSIRNNTSATYDFWTGLVLTSTDPNGRMDSTTYNPNTLRPTQSNSSTGAYSQTFYDDNAMTITSETHSAETQWYGGNLVGKSVKYLNGIGKVKREDALGAGSVWDTVETKYTNLGQVWRQSTPYRAGETVYWSENFYDLLGRTIQVASLDTNSQPFNISTAAYNENARPSSASNSPGETLRQTDPWGRERWSRTDALGRMVEVVEPNPDSNGLLSNTGNLRTNYIYNTMGNLTETEQGGQHRYFKYDTLGRMIRQKLAEQSATINDAGVYVGENGAGAMWSSAVLQYDSRSNIIISMDARGVKTNYSYQLPSNEVAANGGVGGDDPLNRIRAVSYDSSVNPNIVPVAPVYYQYKTDHDQDRIYQVTTANVTDEYTYDPVEFGRVISTKRNLLDPTRSNLQTYNLITNYIYDSLNRVTSVQYPQQFNFAGSPTKVVTNKYDMGSSLNTLFVDNQQQAGNIVYNAAGQTTSINVGLSGANQIQEQYNFDPQTGLLVNQKAVNANNQNIKLIDLSYDYARNNSAGNTNAAWKTGAVTKILDNLNHNKDREYQYDSLGRLAVVKGGVNGALSQQTYQYDRWGNRTAVNLSPGSLAADNSAMPRDGIANLAYESASNRINTAGWSYDPAGNQTRGLADNQTDWNLYEYDAANRLIKISKDNGVGNQPTLIQTQEFGVGNERIAVKDASNNQRTYYYGSIEYNESSNSGSLVWSKSYVYLGGQILSTASNNGQNGETLEFNHPDRLGTKVVTNQNAGTSIEQNALPFGTALGAESSTTTTSKRFTSYERSSLTKLDYAQNRTYDSKQGRFTQVDPIGISSSSLVAPQTLNLYSYCGNDPINRTDPSGLFWGAIWRAFKKVINIVIQVVVAFLGMSNQGSYRTPGWNPNARTPGFGNSVFNSRYIIQNFASTLQQRNFSSIFTFASVFNNFLSLKLFKKLPCPPTIAYLMNNDPSWFQGLIKEANKRSKVDYPNRVDAGRAKEIGGWFLISPNGKKFEYYIKPSMPEPHQEFDLASRKWVYIRGDSATKADLNYPESWAYIKNRLSQGWLIVGEFHTHPQVGDSRDDDDSTLATNRQHAGVIFSSDGQAFAYGPEKGIYNIGVPKGCK